MNTKSLPQTAAYFGVADWQVRRLFERGSLPEPPRIGLHRAIPETLLPKIKAALIAAGYLSEARPPRRSRAAAVKSQLAAAGVNVKLASERPSTQEASCRG